jgi:hypothetical protein
LMRRSKVQWLREAGLYRSPCPHEQSEMSSDEDGV